MTSTLEEVKDILTCAIKELKELADVPVEDSLKSVTTDIILDVKGVAKLVGAVLRVCAFLPFLSVPS